MVKFLAALIFLTFFVSKNIYAQELTYYNYGTDAGLPSSETYDIIQDSKGFIWIATDRGVSQFDGYKFRNFTTNDGLIDNTVLNLYEDDKGRIWFLAISGQLCYYSNGIITPYPYNSNLTESKKFIIRSFFCDKNENLTIGTIGSGIIGIDANGELKKVNESYDFRSYSIQIENGELSYGSQIGTTKNDSIIVDYKNGTHHFKKFVVFVAKATSNMSGVLRKNGSVLVRFPGHIFSHDENGFTLIAEKYEVLRFYEDDDSSLWASLISGGVRHYAPNEPLNSAKFELLLKNQQITSILQDAEKSIWISTLSNGIFYLPSLEFKTFHMPNKFSITDIEYDSVDSSVLVGYNNGIISRFNKSGLQNSYNINTNKADSVTTVFGLKKKDNLIFVSAGDKALYIENEMVILNENKGYIRNIIQVGDELWGCSNHKIIGYNPEKDESRFIAHLSIRTENFYVDKSDKIWIGDYTGLYFLEDTSLVKAFPENKLFNERISGIGETQSGLMLISTIGKGLLIRSNDKTFQLTEKDGLTSDIINCQLIDGNDIWLGTNKGISHLVFDNNGLSKIEKFTDENGLPGVEINNILKTDNLIWASTKNKLFYFDPKKIVPNEVEPAVYIEKVLVAGKEIKTEDSSFLYSEAFPIRINFKGLAYRKKGEVVYKYRLMQSNISWQYTTTPYVEFYSLPAGAYTFEVLACNENGIWSNSPAKYKFIIIPPFWKRTWFIVIMIVFLLITISAIFYLRIGYIRKQNKLNNDILKYQQQALAGQINPHFLHNALNSIQAFIMTDDKRSASKYLSRFSSLMRKSLEHSRQEMVLLMNEIELIDTYVSLERLRFSDKFKFEIQITDKIEPDAIFIPALIVQPFIENAILHGVNESNKTDLKVQVIFDLIDSVLTVTILDNGVGIDSSKQKKQMNESHSTTGTGILITTARLRTLCKSMNLFFKFEMIDLMHENAMESGTRVTFNLPYKTL